MFFFPTNVCEWKKIIEPMIVFKGKKKGLEKYLIQYEKWCQRDARNQRFFFFFFFWWNHDEIRGFVSVFISKSRVKTDKCQLKKTQPQRRHFDVDILNFSWALFSAVLALLWREGRAVFPSLSIFFFSLLALALPCSRSPLKKVGLPPDQRFP